MLQHTSATDRHDRGRPELFRPARNPRHTKADSITKAARRTATPVANRGIWRHPMAFREFESLLLNGLQQSVNRKVQGSNPCPGANLKFGTLHL